MSTILMRSHAEQFAALDAFLTLHQTLWRPAPFTQLTLPWEQEHRELAAALRHQTLAQAEQLHAALPTQGLPAPWPTLTATAAELCRLDDLQPRAAAHASEPPAVPGRKWLQIKAFAAALQFERRPGHWLDWCAGKGHLGRALAADGGKLTALEIDPTLTAAAVQLSQRANVAATHLTCDVMQQRNPLGSEHTAVALHACGDLHARLIETTVANRCGQLALAPCCYNRTQAQRFVPLSALASRSALHLSRDELGVASRETATAGARVRRQRDQSMAWRLGFDLLQREARGSDTYLPTPSLPSAWLQKSFADYCRDLAHLKAVELPAKVDWPHLEQAGWQRLATVRNLELVRALFRRPLEVWLFLDRVLYLEESGYRVRTGEFCPRAVTPRNLMLIAERVTDAAENRPATIA